MLTTLATVLVALVALTNFATAGKKGPRQAGGGSVAGGYAPFINATIDSTSPVSLNILTKTGVRNATAPYLYGWMFEDINHSGDGGLYGELLTNRAFDGSDITWGLTPGFIDDSIVYQENPCVAFGKSIRY